MNSKVKNTDTKPTSSSAYKLSSKPAAESGFRTLKLEEVNIVSSYYAQDGNNSAVTGGVGTEKLFDIANSLDIKLFFTDKKARKHSISADASIDYYSSASSDNIDPRSVSSASMTDVHFYPTLSWSRKDDKKHNTVGASLSYSTEWDYQSYGGNLNFSKTSKDNNTELSLKLGAFLILGRLFYLTKFAPKIMVRVQKTTRILTINVETRIIYQLEFRRLSINACK